MSVDILKTHSPLTRLFCILIGAVILTGCASGPTQQALDTSKEVFKAGDVKRSLESYEGAYKLQMNKDTPYYLEKGYLLRLLGTNTLSQSSQTLLEADKVVSNWEAQATADLAKSSLDFMNYFFSFIKSNATYELKDFEKSMLSYTLAVNHVLAGRMDLAGVEARKMAQREKLIEALHEKKMVAIREKEAKSGKGKQSGASSRIEDIRGYPINVIQSPEINALKNAYQSAAAHYLAGFIFESQDEKGLAAAGYRLAAELKPDVKLFRESLGQLDSSSSNDGAYADTLIIIETGYVPRVYSHKMTYPIPTFRGPRFVTIRLPVIDAYQSLFHLSNVQVDDKAVNVVQAVNLDTMVRRQLKDEMPGFVLKATTQAITQVVAQEAAYHAGKASQGRGSRNDGAAAAALVGQLAAIAAGAALSAGDVDVRAWTTLPGAIYIGRMRLKKGEARIAIPSPNGPSRARIELKNNYELVYARILGNGAVILNKATPEAALSYLNSSTSATKTPPRTEPPQAGGATSETSAGTLKKVNCEESTGFNKFMGLFGSKKEDSAEKENDCK